MRFRPAICIWFVFAQFCFKFYQNGRIQRLIKRLVFATVKELIPCIKYWVHVPGHSEVRYIFFDTPCVIARHSLAIAYSIQHSRSYIVNITEIVSISLIKYLSMTTIKYCSLRQRLHECFMLYRKQQIYRPMTKRVSANGIKGAPQKTKTIENDVLLGGVYVNPDWVSIRIELVSFLLRP